MYILLFSIVYNTYISNNSTYIAYCVINKSEKYSRDINVVVSLSILLGHKLDLSTASSNLLNTQYSCILICKIETTFLLTYYDLYMGLAAGLPLRRSSRVLLLFI